MIKYVDYITPEEYMALRKKVGWMEFPLEEAWKIQSTAKHI